MTRPPCPLRGRHAYEDTGIRPGSPYKAGARLRIQRCTSCGLFATLPAPSDDELRHYYDADDYYSSTEASRGGARGATWLDVVRVRVRRAVVARWFGRETAAWDLSAVVARFARRRFGWAPAGLSGTRLLDVGSGDGTFLLDVRAAGWNAVGLDVSSRAAANAARLGLDVRVGELTQRPFEPDTFDVVRLWSVLEHVREPLETMREVACVLRPGGWAIVQVPNARGAAARALGQRWVGWEVPAHLWHFTPATLRRLLHDAGLVPTELHHTSVGTLAHALRTERVAAGRLVVALVDLLFDLVGAGDSIMAFARRPSAPAGGSPT